MRRQLYRSRSDRRLAGVAGGIAAYLGVSSTLVRVVWVLSAILLPPKLPFDVLLYAVLWVIIPPEPAVL